MRTLGFNDEVCTCELCGKRELKGTYIVEHDDGTIVHYGSTCYSHARGIDAKEIKKEWKAILQEKMCQANHEIFNCAEGKELDEAIEKLNAAGIRFEKWEDRKVVLDPLQKKLNAKKTEIEKKYGLK